jgi:hypothetical protein
MSAIRSEVLARVAEGRPLARGETCDFGPGHPRSEEGCAYLRGTNIDSGAGVSWDGSLLCEFRELRR